MKLLYKPKNPNIITAVLKIIITIQRNLRMLWNLKLG